MSFFVSCRKSGRESALPTVQHQQLHRLSSLSLGRGCLSRGRECWPQRWSLQERFHFMRGWTTQSKLLCFPGGVKKGKGGGWWEGRNRGSRFIGDLGSTRSRLFSPAPSTSLYYQLPDHLSLSFSSCSTAINCTEDQTTRTKFRPAR